MPSSTKISALQTTSTTKGFSVRHIGPQTEEIASMLSSLNLKSLDELTQKTIPESILSLDELHLSKAFSEEETLEYLARLASSNQIKKSLIGLGYSNCITPPVILRNVLENPSWYTSYTPYQAEISQGRLEALLNFQTMIIDLTGMEIANASLLDEATAAAEAMTFCKAIQGKSSAGKSVAVSRGCHPQTIEILTARAKPLGIPIHILEDDNSAASEAYFAVVLQYPETQGGIRDYSEILKEIRNTGGMSILCSDLLSLTLLKPPGEMGADVVVGSTQRFGVPLGFGGPHAAYFATLSQYQRQIPGRMVGVSKDNKGRPALRLALQTREQHIRREKATSNICTAQVLLAVMASMYAVYHGPTGLQRIAQRIATLVGRLAKGIENAGLSIESQYCFDTITFSTDETECEAILEKAETAGYNLRLTDIDTLSITLDETTSEEDVSTLLSLLGSPSSLSVNAEDPLPRIPEELIRTSQYLKHPAFNSYHSETEMLRYLHRLQQRDLSLTNSMIPLGSCTMKLNATSEMIPITYPGFCHIHPFAPLSQVPGYLHLLNELETMLCRITGFSDVSLQPNAGSQGEYAGLLVIRRYLEYQNQEHRNICLIPNSAHGTNPASAVMAGLRVVVVACDADGNIDIEDLHHKAEMHAENLAALMVTYPSTHGVFEESICSICDIVHSFGGQVYLDGANMNALVGLCKPADFGADVAHLNLHKTFCIPHGGGGPGVGPIGVQEHLAPFLPGHSLTTSAGPISGIPAISAAPWGSAGILPISFAYITMMGSEGLKRATQVAILNANYIAFRLADHYEVLYKGRHNLVAHECIIDFRPFRKSAGITVDDVAKRLMDFGFHAPTMSWPVPGTLMIEPTESESKKELDRFCEAMLEIRSEIRDIENGVSDRVRNPLKNAPHTAEVLISDDWSEGYSRTKAAYPLDWVRDSKFWPPVSRVDNAFGDRNLICSCLPVEDYQE